jgi:HAD superfamily hydrolase (TIGR01509 family)
MDDGLVSSAADLGKGGMHPTTTIVVFDLHDVLVRRDYAATAWKAPYVAFEYIKHPTFLWRLQSARSFEDAYQTEHSDYADGLEGVKQTTIETANCQVPMEGMAELLEELSSAGCILYLFSNIGGIVLDHLREKYPTLFQHFHGFHTPTQHNGYAKKPKPESYKSFLDLYNAERDHTVVFFDDKQANIDAANQNGFIGIQFVNAAQARAYLVSLGILPSKP